MTTANTARLQHPYHEHALILQELSENFSLYCLICELPAKGPVYLCIDCNFFLHRSCAELPPEIQHPSHPQHSLMFYPGGSYDLSCRCDEPVEARGSYVCDVCEVALHTGCAAATLPPPEEEHEDKGKIIQHFAHEHPLASFHVNASNRINCKACGEQISGRVYGCRACIYVLHESCALAPREISNHPFHPQHPLTLLADFKPEWPDLTCEVCKRYSHCPMFAYNCNECDFHLDVNCAVSVMHLPPRDDQSSMDGKREIHHFSHPHQLTSFHAKAELFAACSVCKEKEISGYFYCCLDCLFLLDVSCVEFPQDIVHPLHSNHPLICQEDFDLRCSLCSDNTHSFGYKCEVCLFGLHVKCALQSLSATEEELTLTGELVHDHPMKLQCSPLLRMCKVCEWPVEGLGYDCQEGCDMLLHKTCAELPREPEHPIHPQHPLVLHCLESYTSLPCFACFDEIGVGFSLYCDYCKIQFHARCAMGKLTLKHQRHEHSLTYMEKMGSGLNSVQCNVCYEDCQIDFYRCGPCNYNLHFSCLPLPPSVKHEFHFHPLVLRDRVVDDFYDYEEQYCDVCETLRHPEHGVYYCEECNYDAHIDCVIPEVSPPSQNSTTFSEA
ncbi:hypothetical protein CDL15_Pgr000772 [Punica granatum]|uniref:Phorbol-ester/DAG-type domain-containing protein n=2 Tax=Punica granatum TaxID=22663 RepID=A0A218W4T9_PUNGR|nr:hypothetical protein CDL15_Pgr000772 [Punica granatum]